MKTMLPSPACQIHLVPDDLASARCPASPPSPLVLPQHPVWLGAGSSNALQLSAEPPLGARPRVRLEPLLAGRSHPRLLLLAPVGCDLRVNDASAPLLSVLREGDHFRFPDFLAYHVVIFKSPIIGVPPSDKIGQACPACLIPFAASSVCYTCHVCGVALHLEGAGEDDSQLQCARLYPDCPRCHSPILKERGYGWYPPEVCHD